MRLMIAALSSLAFTAATAGDFEDGMASANRKDFATAFAKFRSAAQKGSAEAQTIVGMMFNEGRGVTQDYKEAARWYLLAAQQGLAQAQYNLAVMFEDGQGVAQDYKEAVRWYQLAAKQGKADAQYNLGRMYGNGQGVKQDHMRAHMWFIIAAVGGDKVSVKNRDIAASKMTAQQIEQAQRIARECMNSNFTKCD